MNSGPTTALIAAAPSFMAASVRRVLSPTSVLRAAGGETLDPCEVRRWSLEARGRIVGEELGHRDELVVPLSQLADQRLHGRHRLAAVAAAVVHQHDRAGVHG